MCIRVSTFVRQAYLTWNDLRDQAIRKAIHARFSPMYSDYIRLPFAELCSRLQWFCLFSPSWQTDRQKLSFHPSISDEFWCIEKLNGNCKFFSKSLQYRKDVLTFLLSWSWKVGRPDKIMLKNSQSECISWKNRSEALVWTAWQLVLSHCTVVHTRLVNVNDDERNSFTSAALIGNNTIKYISLRFSLRFYQCQILKQLL